jgi:hypothetical protein
MSFNFKTQLKAGKLGEMLYLKANEGAVTENPKFDYDFITTTGGGIELKTDFYSMESTPNMFIERYSDSLAKTPGGPWQAISKGAQTFVYFYVPSLTYFTFDTAQLVGRLEQLIPNIKPYDVRNTTHVTQGYRVPRSEVADLATVTTLKVVKQSPCGRMDNVPPCGKPTDHPYACGCKDCD